MAWFFSTTLTTSGDLAALRDVFLARRASQRASVDATVSSIVSDVRTTGDVALLSLTRQFDCPGISTLRVPNEAILAARQRIAGSPLETALLVAKDRITRFHQAHRRYSWLDDSVPGERLGQRIIPFACVGIYVPGGQVPLVSTVLMTVTANSASDVSLMNESVNARRVRWFGFILVYFLSNSSMARPMASPTSM